MGGEERGWVAYAGLADGTFAPSPGSRRRPAARVPVPTGSRCGRSWPTWRGWDGARCGKSCTPPVPTWGPRWPRPSGRTSARWTRAPAVVTESWRPYDHVNVQAGLEAWLAEPGREYEVIGVTAFQNREFGLADFLDEAGPVDPWGPRPGNVATVNVPCGPDSAVRACVACADLSRRRGRRTGRRCCCVARGPRHAPGGDPGGRLDRAGGGRPDRRRGTAVSVASTTSFAVRCCPSEGRCSARTAAC